MLLNLIKFLEQTDNFRVTKTTLSLWFVISKRGNQSASRLYGYVTFHEIKL